MRNKQQPDRQTDGLSALRRRVAELESALASAKHEMALTAAEADKHRRIVEALRESEARYRAMVEKIPIIMYSAALDEKSTTLYVSPQVRELLGVTPEDYAANPDIWRQRLHPDDRRRVMAEVRHARVTRQPLKSEYRMIRGDGSVAWFRDEASVLKDERGKPVLLQGAMFDITEQKRAEEALRESEQKYRHLFDSAPAGIGIADLEGNVLDANPPMLEMTGYTLEELGKVNVAATYRDARDRQKLLQGLRKSGGARDFEVQLKRKDGTVYWALLNVDVITMGGRKVLLTSERDITERKKAEQALEESERKFRNFFEAVPVGIYRTTPDGRIVLANSALVRMLGYSSFEELSSRNLEKQGFEPNYPRSWFKELIEAGSSVIGLESVWRAHEGARVHVRESAVATRDRNGKTLYYDGVVEDITSQKLSQESLQKAHGKLVKAREQERKRLAAELHDSVGQALIALQLSIRGIAACDGQSDPEQLRRCNEAAERCAQLAREIRSIGHGLYPSTLESLGLMPSIREMMRICRDAGMAASVSCCKALQKFGLPADVEIALFRIAQEAVNNAVRHSRARKVKLELDYNDGYVRLSVVDDGVGFDVAGAGGRGLGLNSMKERAEAIGGILEIISRKSGTRVKIRAPAKLLKQRP